MLLLPLSGLQAGLDEQHTPDLDKIIQRGTLRVGTLSVDVPPFIIHPHADIPQGLDAVIALDIGQKLGVDIKFVPCSPYWDDLVEFVATGHVDIALSEISITLGRDKRIDFTIPYTSFRDALAIDRAAARSQGLFNRHGDFRIPEKGEGLTIGTVRKSAYARDFFMQVFPRAQPRLFDSVADGFAAMQQRQIALFYFNETFIWKMLQDKPELALYYTVTSSSHTDPIAIAVGPGRPQLLRWLNLYIERALPALKPADIFSWYEHGMTNDILYASQPFSAPVAIGQQITRLHSLLVWATGHRLLLYSVSALVLLLAAAAWLVPAGTRLQFAEHTLLAMNRLLRNRLIFLLGIGGGILFGITFRETAKEWLQQPAQVFLAALHMCALPFVFSAVTGSMARLVHHGKARFYTLRIMTKLVYALLIALVLVTLCAAVVPFSRMMTPTHSENLGRIVLEQEDALINIAYTQTAPDSERLFPGNIVRAMFYDNMLAVLAFSMLLGLALGSIDSPASKALLHGLDGVYEGIQLIVNWVLLLLPPGLFCLLGYSMSLHEPWVLTAMSGYILAFYTIALLAIGIMIVLLALRLNQRPWAILTALKRSLTVAFASGSPYATIPVALEELESTPISSRTAAAVLPLSFAFCDIKKLLIFALSIFFFAALYNIPMRHHGIWHMIPLSILLTSLQTTGMRSAIYLPFITLLLAPFNIPSATAVTLLFVVYPLIDPIGSVLNLLTGTTISALVSHTESV
jgi:proton glutamate symport protein